MYDCECMTLKESGNYYSITDKEKETNIIVHRFRHFFFQKNNLLVPLISALTCIYGGR